MMTDQAPGEFDTGGVRVIVPLSIVVTIGSGRKEIMFRAALALGAMVREAPKRADVRSAMTFFLIRPLSNFSIITWSCDTL
jgi:hypothetical protein